MAMLTGKLTSFLQATVSPKMPHSTDMTKDAKFLMAVLLIAGALLALRFCHPHSGPLKQEHTDPA